MRSVARSYAPLVATVRRQTGWRGAGSLATNNVLTSRRGIHLLSRGAIEAAWLSPALSSRGLVVTAPRALLGQTQIRSFKKANYVEKVTDNEKTEEVLEALKVRDDEKGTQPSRQVLKENGEKPSSGQDTESHEMTKGEVFPEFTST